MRLYRSIGKTELQKLLREVRVRGMYDCAFESQNKTKLNNVICTFTQDFRWKDKDHLFYIIMEIPDERIIEKNEATYYVSKDAIKNRIWSGRDGQEILKMEEAYLDEYSIDDVVAIKGIKHYANWYIEEHIKPISEKYGITLEN